MQLLLPQVLEYVVHGPAVVELLLELDALARHLDVAEDTQQRRRQLLDVRVRLKEIFATETENKGPLHNEI